MTNATAGEECERNRVAPYARRRLGARTGPSRWTWTLIAVWMIATGGGLWMLNPNPFGAIICRSAEPS